MALYSIVFLGSTPIGGPITGWLSEAIDPRAGLVLAGSRRAGGGDRRARRLRSRRGARRPTRDCEGVRSRSRRCRRRGRRMAGGDAIAPQPRCPDQPDRLQRGGRLDVEAHPVALLDRAHGPLAVAPRERVEDREPGAHRGHLRATARRARPRSARRPRSATAAGRRSAPRSRWAARSRFAPRRARATSPRPRATEPPRTPPRTIASAHQPAGQDQGRARRLLARRQRRHRAEDGRRPADQQHGQPEQVDEQHQLGARSASGLSAVAQGPEHLEQLAGPATTASASSEQLRRSLVGGDPDADRRSQSLPASTSSRRARKASRSVRSSPANSASSRPCSIEQAAHGGPLVDPGDRPQLQHLPPPARLEAGSPGRLGDLAGSSLGRLLVGRAAPVQGLDRALVLEPQAGAAQRLGLERQREVPGRAARASPSAASRVGSWSPGASTSRPWLPA